MTAGEPAAEELEAVAKRLERERRARREAETIAERVTAQLYASGQELERLNEALLRTNDELQTVNQSLRDFVAVASHDLRGPLTSVIGFASLLEGRWEQIADAKRQEFIATIVRQGRHLDRLVEDLLTVSKIEAGALSVHREVVCLSEVLARCIEEFTQHASEVHVDAPSLTSAFVDPAHLERIVVNFVSNALKYGAPPVDVEASENGAWVEIRVRDQGDGVPLEFVPRLFGRFARADTEATREKRGTGLGLSIVQGLARANGGDTWYEPNEPHGSCFGVRLPKPA